MHNLQALIIDSWFDNYQGVVSLVRVMNGEVKKGDKMVVMSTGQTHIIDKVGIFTPKQTETGVLKTGEVGFIIAGIKEIHGAPVGDTLPFIKKKPSSHCQVLKKFNLKYMRVFSQLALMIMKTSVMH